MTKPMTLVCPKCKRKVPHFIAYTEDRVVVYSYDGSKFKMLDRVTDFTKMIFVCPVCDEIVSKNKEGIDYYIQRKFMVIKK